MSTLHSTIDRGMYLTPVPCPKKIASSLTHAAHAIGTSSFFSDIIFSAELHAYFKTVEKLTKKNTQKLSAA